MKATPTPSSRYTPFPELLVDLTACETGYPCSKTNTCRIHKIRAFFKDLGWIEDPKPKPIKAYVVEPEKK